LGRRATEKKKKENKSMVIRCTYKSDNTRCHATPKTVVVVVVVVVVAAAAAAIPYRIILRPPKICPA